MASHTRARAQGDEGSDFPIFFDDDDPSDAEDLDDPSPGPGPGQDPAPLTNPPPSHKLSTHKYDTLDELMADLQEYCGCAQYTGG